MAVPTPPPITTTVPKFSIWLGLPKGPTNVENVIAGLERVQQRVVFPTD